MSNQTKLSRREFVTLTAAGLAATAIGGRAMAQMTNNQKTYAYVGSWTQGRFGTGGGGGISVFEVDSHGSLTLKSQTGSDLEDLNAGYLAISADGRFLYSTEEVSDLNEEAGAGGGIFSFAINPNDGSLTHLNTQPSMGSNPSMINIDNTGKMLVSSTHGGYGFVTRAEINDGVPEVVKAYDDATVAIFPINADGTLEPAVDVAILDRIAGVPDSRDQSSPHAHAVVFDSTNQNIIVADKGANRIYSFRLNKKEMKFENPQYITAPDEGVMPRHIAVHQTAPYFFLSHEGAPSLSSYHFDSDTGKIEFVQMVSSLPAGDTGRSRPSDIKLHPNGNFVYTANRSHNSIAIHSIDETTGEMTVVDVTPSAGAEPRGITFDSTGKYLFVANQRANEIATFEVDPNSGKITPTGATAEVLKPGCIKLLQV